MMNAEYIREENGKLFFTEKAVDLIRSSNYNNRKLASIFGIHYDSVRRMREREGVRYISGYNPEYIEERHNGLFFTDKGKEWLSSNYADNTNAFLSQVLGVSETKIKKTALRMGLCKSEEHIRRTKSANGKKSMSILRKMGLTYDNSKNRGKTAVDRYGEERAKEITGKQKDRMVKIIQTERARMAYGCDRHYRMQLFEDAISRKESRIRGVLRKRGYVLSQRRDDGSRCYDVAITTDTNRSMSLEERYAKKFGYKFIMAV